MMDVCYHAGRRDRMLVAYSDYRLLYAHPRWKWLSDLFHAAVDKGFTHTWLKPAYFTWTIFLSDIPATKRFCLSSSGLNLTQYGTFLLVKCEMHLPAETKTPGGTSGLHRKYWFARSSLSGGSHLSQSPRVWDSGRRLHWGTGNQCCWSKYLALLCCGLKTTKDRIKIRTSVLQQLHRHLSIEQTSEAVRSGNGKYRTSRKSQCSKYSYYPKHR